MSLQRLLARAVGTSARRLCAVSTEAQQDSVFDDFLEDIETSAPRQKDLPFPKLLRESKFMQLGDFDGRIITGKIVHRVADDLYIDIGLKFNVVCKAPSVNSENYAVGLNVMLRLHDYELSERFLGSKTDLTLLEADATLVLPCPALRHQIKIRLLRLGRRTAPKEQKTAQ